MIDEGLEQPWPEPVPPASESFLQGHLIEQPPLFYAADLRHPIWRTTRLIADQTSEAERGEDFVDLAPEDRPPYGIITTQSCDLSEVETHVPDPVVSGADGLDPEQEALLADSVGLALLVVLDTLAPAERLAFVLHDMFAVPYDEIAPVVGRSPSAARQLASRARHRVQGADTDPDPDLGRQRAVVDAFLAASRGGDFDALVAVLDPDVVLRADVGAGLRGVSQVIRGADTVARQALLFSEGAPYARPVLVNGAAGTLTAPGGAATSVMAFTVGTTGSRRSTSSPTRPASPSSTSRRPRRTGPAGSALLVKRGGGGAAQRGGGRGQQGHAPWPWRRR